MKCALSNFGEHYSIVCRAPLMISFPHVQTVQYYVCVTVYVVEDILGGWSINGYGAILNIMYHYSIAPKRILQPIV